MKTVGTAPEGGAAALVGFPMKSSKCKFIPLRGTKLSVGFWLLGGFLCFFFYCGFSDFVVHNSLLLVAFK